LTDEHLLSLLARYERNREIDSGLIDRLNSAEKNNWNRREIASCNRRWKALAASDDELARLAVSIRAADLQGVATKMTMWRNELALCGFQERGDLFAFGAYRDLIGMTRAKPHKKDRRELSAARRWSA
jgi:hypothetical protein